MNIGRYRVTREVGRGSMGVVYEAHDPNLDLVVAIKVLRPDRMATEGFARRFLAEAKALGRLDHPNIVRVFNVDEHEGTVYIVMEFLQGDSLGDLMQKRRFSPLEIAEIGASVAEALDDAHAKGIVHRDVKPNNILVRADGRIKITDFGIAHIEDPSAREQTQAGEILGTPAYMSPEQVLGRPVDGRSDIFSLGIILYELCAGWRPFGGENLASVFNAITQEEPPPIAGGDPPIPEGLERAVMKCLRKSPAERYPTGRALAAALRESVALPAPEAVPDAAKPAKSRTPVLLAAIVLLVAAGGVLGFVALRPGKVREAPVPAAAPPPAATSALAVESDPPGALVFVDGAFKGNAPLRAMLVRGKHEVRVTLEGHDDWEAQVDLPEGETPLSVRLAPKESGRKG